MLSIESVNHVGIRIKDKARSVAFYKILGFQFTTDVGFEKGHPIILKHPSGVVLNLLGPSNTPEGENILMDVPEKYAGITHVALTVRSLQDARDLMEKQQHRTHRFIQFWRYVSHFYTRSGQECD